MPLSANSRECDCLQPLGIALTLVDGNHDANGNKVGGAAEVIRAAHGTARSLRPHCILDEPHEGYRVGIVRRGGKVHGVLLFLPSGGSTRISLPPALVSRS